jgi:FkbH-like protein
MTRHPKEIKCLVWDLDNTLWNGVLLEGDTLRLRDGVPEVIRTLDGRGILQSIASRNDHGKAFGKIKALGLDEYFLCPQIAWGPKSASVRTIAKLLNIGTDSLAFIDDEPFERDEVAASVPGVLCIDASELLSLTQRPEFNPRFITVDSHRRRSMYRAEFDRQRTAATMPPEEFLSSLGMVFTISLAGESDLARIEELTIRTNQLNSTGYTYSYEELDSIRRSSSHRLLIAGLDDRYGAYGKVGMALVECRKDMWLLKLLLMSCRVISRGVGKILLSYVLQTAAADGKRVCAEFVRTESNRLMYLTFKLSGFREIERNGKVVVLGHGLDTIEPFPKHVQVVAPPT